MIQNLPGLKSILIAAAGGLGGGMVYVIAAVESMPDPTVMAPDLKTAVYMLAVAIMGAGIKAGIPTKTTVKSLEDRLIEWAERDKEGAAERSAFREKLAGWMAKVDGNQETMKENQEEMKAKLEAVSEKVIAIRASCRFMDHGGQ